MSTFCCIKDGLSCFYLALGSQHRIVSRRKAKQRQIDGYRERSNVNRLTNTITAMFWLASLSNLNAASHFVPFNAVCIFSCVLVLHHSKGNTSLLKFDTDGDQAIYIQFVSDEQLFFFRPDSGFGNTSQLQQLQNICGFNK